MSPLPRRAHSQAGVTLIELMVAVAIMGIVAAIALPRLGKGRQASAARDFAFQLSKDLEMARLRAVTTRNVHNVFLHTNGLGYNVTYTPTGASPTLLKTGRAPSSQSLIWDVERTHNAPSAPASIIGDITFNPDFTIAASVDGTATLEVRIYVASTESAAEGRRYLVSVTGTGAVTVVDTW